MKISKRLLEEVWNQENHVSLFELVHEQPFSFLDLVNVYKAFAPDLTFQMTTRGWSARGHHYGLVDRIEPTNRSIKLSGPLEAVNWDSLSFRQQTGLTAKGFNQILHPGVSQIRLRAIHKTKGVPIVLFPALSLPGWITWRRAIEQLQEQRPVITFQLLANKWAIERRGVFKHYSVKTETKAFIAALQRLGMKARMDVVGHSAGGTLALDFALEYPSRINSLTLIEPGPAWILKPYNDQIEAFLKERIANYSGIITPDRYGCFLRASMGPGYDPERSPFWPWLSLYRNNMKYRPALYDHSDDLSRLGSVTFPVLLIKGKDSDHFHSEIVRTLHSSIPRAEVIEMPGGHIPHQGEGMTVFLKHLNSFASARGNELTYS